MATRTQRTLQTLINQLEKAKQRLAVVRPMYERAREDVSRLQAAVDALQPTPKAPHVSTPVSDTPQPTPKQSMIERLRAKVAANGHEPEPND